MSAAMGREGKGGHLAIGVHYEPSGVDPHVNAAELGLQMTMSVFDTLVVKTADGDYLPGLARAWEIAEEGTRYTFHLREDVHFHDGTPFNAEAVKFSLERARDPANKSQLAGSMLGPYQSATVVDEHAVAVQLAEPYALLLDSLSQGWLAPVSPAAVERYGADFTHHLVGTGPFLFEVWAPNEFIRLRRNPDYRWGPPLVNNAGPAYLEEITFVFLPDDAERTAALEEGSIDGIFYVPPADAKRLRDNAALKVPVWPIRGAPVCLMMNVARTPTDDPTVRRAIAYAVDQETLVQETFCGEFPRAYGPLSQHTLGYESSVEQMYPYDPDEARRLLEQAGWRNGGGVREKEGRRLSTVYYGIPFNYYAEFGQILRRQLAQVGVEVDVKIAPPAEWMEAAGRSEHHLIPQGKFISDPHILSYIYHSRYSGPGAYGWTKRADDERPELDTLLERGERTLDPEAYVPLYREAQKIIMDEAYIAPLHCNTNIVALKKEIEGLRFDAIGAYPYFHDVQMAGERRSEEGTASDAPG